MDSSQSTFTGDRKVPLKSPLAALEKQFIQWAVPRVPRGLEGYHLTLMTIAWTALLLFFGWLGSFSLFWLWGSSLMLFMQWLTDSLDGSLGKYRGTGIPKWGFYMDHLLDYAFMSAVFLQYLPLLSISGKYMMIAWTFLYGIKMVSSWLSFAATGAFKITYLGVGPTEIRLFFIGINTALIFWGVDWLERALPWIIAVSAAGCVLIVHRTQQEIWRLDMAEKRKAMKKG